MSSTPGPSLDPNDPRAGDPTRLSTWVTIGGVIIIIVVIGTVTAWNSFGGGARPTGQPATSVTPALAPTPTTGSFPASGSCNPGDVKLTVHLYGHIDIAMTYHDDATSSDQTSWPAGNAPFPNSFPAYPAPWLRYGCFHAGTTVRLTFNNADEPWTAYSRTTGGGCELSRPLTKGRSYTPAELSAPLGCDIGLQHVDVDVSAYWANADFAGATLTDYAEFPACLPTTTPGYCPPG